MTHSKLSHTCPQKQHNLISKQQINDNFDTKFDAKKEFKIVGNFDKVTGVHSVGMSNIKDLAKEDRLSGNNTQNGKFGRYL